ncbi:MAG: hypothetical protein CMO79_04720 [Verrucomicrobiales bacterium]|nr:hypothetical protein [Verrucomicrobiales bacterium]
MSKDITKNLLGALGALLLFCNPSVSEACSVPVFRYALELWPPDEYEVVLFHKGPLTEEQKQLLDKIKPLKLENASVPNMRIHEVDLKADPDPRWIKWWEENKPEKFDGAWMAIFYPASTLKITPLWAGPFTQKGLSKTFQSPARQKLAKRLQDGDSAVWILLECGNKQKDDSTKKILEERLVHLGKTLKMPELKDQDVQAGYLSIRPEDLKLGFSLLTISADDPDEKVFREILLSSEDDLKEFDEPIAFAVFGRGRAMPALVGKGINNDMIDDACTFLSGPCSCQVKRQNPGFDILTSVNWDELLEEQIERLDDKALAQAGKSPQPETTVDAKNAPAPANEASVNSVKTPSNKLEKNNQESGATPSPFMGWIIWGPAVILGAGVLVLLFGRKKA